MITILHTSDLHIGMKFHHYPDTMKEKLVEARFETLERMVTVANQRQCNLFVVAGDLFDKINVPRSDLLRVTGILGRFAGDCILVLPGNHDFDNGTVDLWTLFREHAPDNLLLLNEYRVYSLREFDIDADIYPAHCDAKHSGDNRLDWIKEHDARRDARWRLGVAHGSLVGISPDMDSSYFPMTQEELLDLSLDLWLVGHTHSPHPPKDAVTGATILNGGTPEPDGLDCGHAGSAWMVTLHGEMMEAERIPTGRFHFFDLARSVADDGDMEGIRDELLSGEPGRKVIRLRLEGKIEEHLYNTRENIYQELREELAHLEVDDRQLNLRVDPETIDREFTAGSFPHTLLNELAADGDDDALQIAYELIREVRE